MGTYVNSVENIGRFTINSTKTNTLRRLVRKSVVFVIEMPHNNHWQANGSPFFVLKISMLKILKKF